MSQEETENFMQPGRLFECAHCKGDKYLDAEKEYGIKCDCTCHDSHPIEPQGSWEEVEECGCKRIKKEGYTGIEHIQCKKHAGKMQEFIDIMIEGNKTYRGFEVQELITEAIKEERERIAKEIEKEKIAGSLPSLNEDEVYHNEVIDRVLSLLTNKDNEV